MITTPQEYYSHLSVIQNQNHPSASPPLIALLPRQEQVYNINLKTRIIDSPEFIGVEKDHAAETIYFLVDRYSDYIDLKDTVCIITYKNALNKTHLYPVPFYDIQSYPGKILIPWNVGAGATIAPGKITYSMTFYKLDMVDSEEPIVSNLLYNLNTLTATSMVLHGIENGNIDEETLIPTSEYKDLVGRITRAENNKELYWTDLYSQ